MSDAVDQLIYAARAEHAKQPRYVPELHESYVQDLGRVIAEKVAEDCAAVARDAIRRMVGLGNWRDIIATDVARAIEERYGLTDNPGATPPRDP